MSVTVGRASSVKDYSGVSSRGDKLISKLVDAREKTAQGSLSLSFSHSNGKGTLSALTAVRALENGEKVKAFVMVRAITKGQKMTGNRHTVRVQAPKTKAVTIDSVASLEKLLAAKVK